MEVNEYSVPIENFKKRSMGSLLLLWELSQQCSTYKILVGMGSK